MLEMNRAIEQNSEVNQVLKEVGSTLCTELQKMFQKDPSSVISVLDEMRGAQAMPSGFASADQLLGTQNFSNNLLSPFSDRSFGQSYAPERAQIVINVYEGSAPSSDVQSAGNKLPNASANMVSNHAGDSAHVAHASKPQEGAFGAMDYLKSGAKLLNQFEQNFSDPNGDPLAGVGGILKGAFGKTGTGAEVGGILGSVVDSLDKQFSPNYKPSISKAAAGVKGNAGGSGLGNILNSFGGQGGGLDGLGSFGEQLSGIGDTATNIFDQAGDLGGDIASGAGDFLGDAAGSIGDFAGEAAGAAGDLVGDAASGIGELAGDIAPALFSLL